jgi:hypothetical protein
MTPTHASANGVGLLSVLVVFGAARAAAPQSPTPAVWIPHAIIVDLDLSERYSCDDLWYRFRVILLSIGANPDLKVVPYHCDSHSPKVQLQFSLPEPVNGAQARFADLRAVKDTITLEPGHPMPLDAADCELVRQIKDELLSELPVRVLSAELSCAAAPTTHTHFRLSLQALRADAPSKSAAAAPPASGVTQASTSSAKQQR